MNGIQRGRKRETRATQAQQKPLDKPAPRPGLPQVLSCISDLFPTLTSPSTQALSLRFTCMVPECRTLGPLPAPANGYLFKPLEASALGADRGKD